MFFDTYASTRELGANKGKLSPIEINDSPINVFNSLKKYLEENDYKEITAKEDYFDLFGIKDDFEVSFNVISNNGKSLLGISIYSDIKKGRVKKRLKIIYEEMLERFERFM